MNVYEKIIKKSEKGTVHMTLIDPATSGMEGSARIAREAERAGTDFILIGGSTHLTIKEMDQSAQAIKEGTEIPVIIFPGSSDMFTTYADAIFFMSLLNSRDREFIMDHQVKAARIVKASGMESIPMGYLIFEPGMTVGRVGKAQLIGRTDSHLAVNYALAAELLGMKLVYMEAGSGASQPISTEVIREVRKYISIPVIVGGGIRTPSVARSMGQSGASIIVTGTIAEQSVDVYKSLKPIIDAIK
ncbi:MAG: phosphoglycerol geranylgeranyltransferase [Cuniculiplasma sp.]